MNLEVLCLVVATLALYQSAASPPDAMKIVPVCGPDKPATVIHRAVVNWEPARDGLGKAVVTVIVTVDQHGRAVNVALSPPTQASDFNLALVKAAKDSIYSPATVNCKPVQSKIRFEMEWDSSSD